MGLFSGLLGNASQKDADAVERDLANILIDGEQVRMAFSLVRDLIVFTEYRLETGVKDKPNHRPRKCLTVRFRIVPYRAFRWKPRAISIWMPS